MKFRSFIRWIFESSWRAIVVALPLLCFAAYLALLTLASAIELIHKDVSPTNKGMAIFYSPVDLRDATLDLWIRDYGGTNQPYFISRVGVTGSPVGVGDFKNSVWSKDGTVIVAYGGIIVSPQGYDFKSHVKVEGAALEQLLVERGGVGKQVFSDAASWEQQCRRPWPWEVLE